MADPPGASRKSYFPTSQDIAGYSTNRQLTEGLRGLEVPSQFETFTLFPEANTQSSIESPEFVWGDLTNHTSYQLPSSDCFSSPLYSHSSTNLQNFEDYHTRGACPDLSPPVHSPASSSYSPPNGFATHYSDDQNFSPQLGLSEASQQGYNFYANALDDWTNFPTSFPSYSPFGSPETLSYPQSTEKDSGNKPSYSEVARSSRAKSGLTGRFEPSFEEEKRKPDLSSAKTHRSVIRKGSCKAPYHSKGNRPSESLPPTLPVPPDSKYGLDQFDDPTISRKNSSCSSLPDENSSVESLDHLTGNEHARPGLITSEDTPLYKPLNTKPHLRYTTPCKDSYKSKGHKSGSSNSGGSDKSNKMSNQTVTNEGKTETPKLFFDPKRIFQSKHYAPSSSSKKSATGNLTDDKCDVSSSNTTVLNNGKLSNSSKPATTTTPKRSSDYINNDLRDTKRKSSNHGNHASSTKDTDGLEKNVKDASCSGKFFQKSDQLRSENIQQTGKLKSLVHVNPENSVNIGNGVGEESESLTRQTTIDQETIDEWLSFCQEKAGLVCRYTWSITVTLVILLITLIAFVVSRLSFYIVKVCGKIWQLILSKVFRRGWDQTGGLNPGETRLKSGLEDNITLPTTGDEAMQRLLACKGKDPYSILGLRFEASDEEIKKYYKKQAVLVHPDKNQQAGAEEAFKILGHAFELIGEPEKRGEYDANLHEADQTETAMHEFADLLTKLQEKIQEAANMMRCDNCGGKHRRIPVERPWYSARFCDRCNQQHSVKEGDVWAETTMLGFLWHYYACMEGKVFDITEWVACRREFFKHMQPNAHHVFYRIATEGNRNHQQGRSGETDLEDFINHLFHRAMSPEGNESSSQWSGQKTGASSTSSSQGKDSNLRRKKQRKKKH